MSILNILGEDGSNLGQTNNSATQCGNSTTTIDVSLRSQVNAWASTDGIRLQLLCYQMLPVDPGSLRSMIFVQLAGGGSTATGNISYTAV